MSSQEALEQSGRASRMAQPRTLFSPVPSKTNPVERVQRKRGELLQYTPRPTATVAPTAPKTREHTVVICHGGRNFIASTEMADCFLAKARRVVDAHAAELVALLHCGGLELLFIADNIPFSVGTTFEHHASIGGSGQG